MSPTTIQFADSEYFNTPAIIIGDPEDPLNSSKNPLTIVFKDMHMSYGPGNTNDNLGFINLHGLKNGASIKFINCDFTYVGCRNLIRFMSLAKNVTIDFENCILTWWKRSFTPGGQFAGLLALVDDITPAEQANDVDKEVFGSLKITLTNCSYTIGDPQSILPIENNDHWNKMGTGEYRQLLFVKNLATPEDTKITLYDGHEDLYPQLVINYK